MKRILLPLLALGAFAGCQTHQPARTQAQLEFRNLPIEVQKAVRYEVGNSRILSAEPTTFAGQPNFYQVDYLSDGEHKSLKIRDDALVFTKSDWGFNLIEAAGAERHRP